MDRKSIRVYEMFLTGGVCKTNADFVLRLLQNLTDSVQAVPDCRVCHVAPSIGYISIVYPLYHKGRGRIQGDFVQITRLFGGNSSEK